MGNVFVFLKDGLAATTTSNEPPRAVVPIEHDSCELRPRVSGVRVGQTVEFTSTDNAGHVIEVSANANPEFTFTQPANGPPERRFFTTPEVMVRVSCRSHPSAAGYVGVLDHGHFAVTSPSGAFELRGVPPGTYTVEGWHERLGTRAVTLTLPAAGRQEITLTFDIPGASPQQPGR